MPVNHSTRSLAVRASALSLRILFVLALPAPLGGLSLQLQLDHTLAPVVEPLVEPRDDARVAEPRVAILELDDLCEESVLRTVVGLLGRLHALLRQLQR